MLRDIIRKDTEFMCYHNLMDYSLLFAVEKFSENSITDKVKLILSDAILTGMGKGKV